MGKTQVTILSHDHWYTLMKYVDDRLPNAQLALQREVMTKVVADWKQTHIPDLTEYYSSLHLLGETLERPYLSEEHYANLKKKIVEQGKEGIPVEQSIFDQIKNYITIIDTLQESLTAGGILKSGTN